MPINWQEILTTLAATIGGGGVLLGAAAWLIKAVISNRLALDAEKFKIEIKTNADTEIERVKADLTRSLHVHERQLDIIGRLYRHLQDAQALFQSATRSGRFGAEITPEQYMPLVTKAMDSARDELVQGRLLIPQSLCSSATVSSRLCQRDGWTLIWRINLGSIPPSKPDTGNLPRLLRIRSFRRFCSRSTKLLAWSYTASENSRT